MKIFLFILILIYSCKTDRSIVLPIKNTYQIDNNDSNEDIIIKASHVVPTKNQYQALKNEFIAFIHFGPNTFTRMEWGNGMEDPKVFNLKNLDTDQWCETMKDAGMKMVIITAKHHDGFVLWQSRYTNHGIMSTGFKEGKGDIVKELSKSCEKYGLKLGIYLSPADLYQIENINGLYGNLSEYKNRVIPKQIKGRPFKNKTTFSFKVDDYNEYFLNQLFELLTEYGPISEVWFDGAHPKRKGGQKYNYLAWKKLINSLAPNAVIFGKQDIRWCGNESGNTRNEEWNIIPYLKDPNQLNDFKDSTAPSLGSREEIYNARFLHYQQAETNTSIREGWFYRDDNIQKVRSTDDVFDIYERSVGGNSTFLLNIPPNREGKFSNEDVAVLSELGKRIRETYSINLFENAIGPKKILDKDDQTFEVVNDNELIIETKDEILINRLTIKESILTHSERVEKFKVQYWKNETWIDLFFGNNIGYKKILRFPEIKSNKFKIKIEKSRMLPAICSVEAHYYKSELPEIEINEIANKKVVIKPLIKTFNWKPHGEDITLNLNPDFEIRYTTDNSEPTKNSKLFKDSISLGFQILKAKVFLSNRSSKTYIFNINN
ncbi:alpha-L-fucosidase [Flavobacteriaceae bacterium]|nr:alpha-L-fucosidase [Flavobacteriaceae bacterium]